MSTNRLCSLCPRRHYARGYCRPHYRAHVKWGDPNHRPPSLGDRMRANYTADPHGCWLWTGQLNNKGYGVLSVAGRKVAAHRVNYELLVGAIAPGLELDHLCNTPACVRPDHLEPVTHAENMRRIQDRQTACRRAGHDWTDPRNVYVRRDGRRHCRVCAREAAARRRAGRAR